MSVRLGRARIDPILAEAVYRKTLGLCWYCGDQLGQRRRHIDHQNPRSRGGKDTYSDLVPACSKCNLAKGAMNLEEYREKVKDLLPAEFAKVVHWLEATTWFSETQADRELTNLLRDYLACLGSRSVVFYGESFNTSLDYCI